MSRNLMDENYYVSHGGKVPVKWTAPEVGKTEKRDWSDLIHFSLEFRLSITRSTPLPVMCGVLVVSCMKYGASDTNHLKIMLMWK